MAKRKLKNPKVNQYGVEVSTRRYNMFLNAQKSANDIIMRHAQRFDDLPTKIPGAPDNVAPKVGDIRGGSPSPFIYSKSFDSFTSEKEFDSYLARLVNFNEERLMKNDEQFRDNFISAIRYVYGEEKSKEAASIIKAMSIEDFIREVYVRDIDISFVYTEEDRDNAWENLLSILESL